MNLLKKIAGLTIGDLHAFSSFFFKARGDFLHRKLEVRRGSHGKLLCFCLAQYTCTDCQDQKQIP